MVFPFSLDTMHTVFLLVFDRKRCNSHVFEEAVTLTSHEDTAGNSFN